MKNFWFSPPDSEKLSLSLCYMNKVLATFMAKNASDGIGTIS